MKRSVYSALTFLAGIASALGCGGGSTKTIVPPNTGCANILITGTLEDSLTSLPLSQGLATIEVGAELGQTPLYDFSVSQQVASDANGRFSLCTPASLAPVVIVLTGFDSTGLAYPPLVAQVTASTDFATVLMGACRLTCAFNQQQTSSTANINGSVFSSPIAIGGQISPYLTVSAIDGSQNLWNLLTPQSANSEPLNFKTAASGCSSQAMICSNYSFTLPSQQPVLLTAGKYMQHSGPPTYTLYASPLPNTSCKPPVAISAFQQDGVSPLTANPGANLTAAALSFESCTI